MKYKVVNYTKEQLLEKDSVLIRCLKKFPGSLNVGEVVVLYIKKDLSDSVTTTEHYPMWCDGSLTKNWEFVEEIKPIIIKNRDFSVLEGLESVNKWGLKTKTKVIYGSEYITLFVFDEIEESIDINIHLTNVSDEYIIDNFELQGFDIEFEDAKEINIIEELLEVDDEITIWKSKGGVIFCCIFDGGWEDAYNINKKELEKKYNLKINLNIA